MRASRKAPYGTGRAAQEAIADFVDNYEAPLTALVA
jgi:hypothetical protein